MMMYPRLAQEGTTMAGEVRMNLQVSAEINELLERIAKDTGSNRSEVIRQALALMKVAQEAKKKGKHIGLVSDADKLDTEIVGLL
jgi:predicted transcriptional regulator